MEVYIEEQVEEFLELQRELLQLFFSHYPPRNENLSSFDYLSLVPRTGTVSYLDALWGYHIHGLGVRFINIATLVVVEAHDRIFDHDALDLFRLRVFFESMGYDYDDDIEARISVIYNLQAHKVSPTSIEELFENRNKELNKLLHGQAVSAARILNNNQIMVEFENTTRLFIGSETELDVSLT